jgi:hypothetical protein
MRVSGGIIPKDPLVAEHIRETYDFYYPYCRKNLNHSMTTDSFEIQITLRKDGSVELVKGT